MTLRHPARGEIFWRAAGEKKWSAAGAKIFGEACSKSRFAAKTESEDTGLRRLVCGLLVSRSYLLFALLAVAPLAASQRIEDK